MRLSNLSLDCRHLLASTKPIHYILWGDSQLGDMLGSAGHLKFGFYESMTRRVYQLRTFGIRAERLKKIKTYDNGNDKLIYFSWNESCNLSMF